jgi:hypothetical protein
MVQQRRSRRVRPPPRPVLIMASKKHQRHSANRPVTWRRGNTSRINRQHPWRQSCPTHKVGYPNPENAALAAVLTGQHYYQCPECQQWHLTRTRQ